MVAWSTLSKEMNIYDNNHANHVFEVKEGFSTMLPLDVEGEKEFNGISSSFWELLSSTTLWALWKARCITIFDNQRVPPVEIIQEIV